MADVYCIVNRTVKLEQPTSKMELQEPLAYDNTKAHAMQVTVVNDDGPEDLSGISVVGSFLNAQGNTVDTILGTVSGNVAQVILPAACYAVPGRFKFTMNMSKDDSVRTVLWVNGHVEKNTGGTPIDPGTPVTNYSTIIQQANEIVQAMDGIQIATVSETKDYLGIT